MIKFPFKIRTHMKAPIFCFRVGFSLFAFVMFGCISNASIVYAQQDTLTVDAVPITAEGDASESYEREVDAVVQDIDIKPKGRRVDPESIPSVLFTYWEYSALEEAKNSRGVARAPDEADLMRDLEYRGVPVPPEEKVKPPPEERYVRLSGIAYKSKKKWTIWLNNKRVTKDAVPEEVIDLRVYKDYIEVKWFDEYTNRIYPIRLRPHQRFNIDTRIFLPG